MTARDRLIAKLSDEMDPDNAADFVDEVIQEALTLRPSVNAKNAMTKDELLAKLRSYKGAFNPAEAHMDADDDLLDYINDPDIREAFNAFEKWYK